MVLEDPPLDKIPRKEFQNIRLITFNINGYRTVFHYHPWNKLRKFSNMFNALRGDIITLQEIKVAAKDVDNSIGRLEGYYTFLTVPSLKKGYSGVGVYVRIPKDDEPETVKNALKVIKAEEGLTGTLISHDTKVSYKESKGCIGGYPNLDEKISHRIDSEGRSLLIETANNTVVISVYCPANSMGTDEGEHFRVQFLEALFRRIRNLKELGKHVVLMGDINVARDLIDSADGISDRLKNGLLLKVNEKFEELNRVQALNFIRRSIPRILLNELLIDSIDQEPETDKSRVMIDLVRKVQGRKQGLYTVWNTLKNSRPGNYGSRIDLILATEGLAQHCRSSNIWPFLMGSDHCPVYADLDVGSLRGGESLDSPIPRLEARYVYKLSMGSIDSMFANMSKRKASPGPISEVIEVKDTKRPKVANQVQKHNSRSKPKKVQKNDISSFFKSNKEEAKEKSKEESKEEFKKEKQALEEQPSDSIPEFEICTSPSQETKKKSPSLSLDPKGQFSIASEKVPDCRHREPCILKTARTKENKGKKFWTCPRPVGHSETKEGQNEFTCGYFQWK